MTHTERGKF